MKIHDTENIKQCLNQAIACYLYELLLPLFKTWSSLKLVFHHHVLYLRSTKKKKEQQKLTIIL